MSNKHKTSILLIGPMGIGKTTISEALAKHYGLPLVDVDDLRKEYYAKMPGYSRDEMHAIYASGGDLHAYFEPFETQQVEMLLELDEPAVFDFGGGHTVKSEGYFKRIFAAFQPYENVVLLTISPDLEETIRDLHFDHREGIETQHLEQYNAMNRKFVESGCNEKLAKRVVYRTGKTVEQTLAEIIAWVDQGKNNETK
ncbi:MAG: shikimate kinase [Erysipelotrichaceae bacterium]